MIYESCLQLAVHQLSGHTELYAASTANLWYISIDLVCTPVACHASVVVEALVEPAPVVSHQVQVKVIAGHLSFAL